jgi:stage IV sporulation protein FA
VIVQHRNGLQSWYGLLEQVEAEKNDWIAAGESVGIGSTDVALAQSYVFLAVKEDESFINPLDVFTVD